MDEVAFWGGAEILAETSFQATDRHAGALGEVLHRDGFFEVLVDVVDEFGDGAVGRGERGAFAVLKTSGDSRRADDGVI